MSKLYNVSLSPHIRAKDTTMSIMLDVIIAIIPALAVGVYVYGLRALLVIALSVVSCVASEYIYEKLLKLPNTVGDLSAVVTGLILAMNLYSTSPWWLPVFGGAFAIIVVKMLYGGLGQNFMNPALASRCFLLISFPTIMTVYPIVDGVSGATPLALLREGTLTDFSTLFLGTHSGTIGETSCAAILIGAAYLIIKRVISPRIPLCMIGSAAVFLAVFGLAKGYDVGASFILSHILSGGLMAGAVFMATDYVTSPVTKWGQVIFAVLIGFLSAFIRMYGGSTEGVSYAIIIANLLTPLIEKATTPKPFGVERGTKA